MFIFGLVNCSMATVWVEHSLNSLLLDFCSWKFLKWLVHSSDVLPHRKWLPNCYLCSPKRVVLLIHVSFGVVQLIDMDMVFIMWFWMGNGSSLVSTDWPFSCLIQTENWAPDFMSLICATTNCAYIKIICHMSRPLSIMHGKFARWMENVLVTGDLSVAGWTR